MSRLQIVLAGMLLLAGPASAQSSAAESPTLTRIAARRTLTIAYRDSGAPFSYVGPDGKAKGYSIDICMKIADAIKQELKLAKLDINFLPVTTQTRVALIANGTADIECAATAITLGRQQQVDFLNVTYVSAARLLVKKGSGIHGVSDLAGKAMVTLLGTTSERAITAEIAKEGLKVDVVRVKDNPQAMLSLEQGRADAFFSDEVLLNGIRSAARTPDAYEVVGEPLFYEPYGFIVARNDADFRFIGNRVIAQLYSSGEINQVYAKWFLPGPTNINLPMSDQLKAAIQLFALSN